MKSNHSIVAIITARGGSKGLPRKNVLDLNGIPLIVHTIDAAKKSNLFSKIIVTTDDEEIKDVSLKHGADVIDRPQELATDTASSLDVITHTLDELIKQNYLIKHFVLLQPTSPLRNAQHIKDAMAVYQQKQAHSLVSVVEVDHSPFKMLILKENKIEPLTNWRDLTKPRQQLPKAYLPNGAIYICNIDEFLKTKNLFKQPLEIFEMDIISSIDIDTKEDMKKVSNLLKRI